MAGCTELADEIHIVFAGATWSSL